MTSLVEIVDKQNAVIRIQSKMIYDLSLLLMQHIGTEEADTLAAIEKINTVASIKEDI